MNAQHQYVYMYVPLLTTDNNKSVCIDTNVKFKYVELLTVHVHKKKTQTNKQTKQNNVQLPQTNKTRQCTAPLKKNWDESISFCWISAGYQFSHKSMPYYTSGTKFGYAEK